MSNVHQRFVSYILQTLTMNTLGMVLFSAAALLGLAALVQSKPMYDQYAYAAQPMMQQQQYVAAVQQPSYQYVAAMPSYHSGYSVGAGGGGIGFSGSWWIWLLCKCFYSLNSCNIVLYIKGLKNTYFVFI